MLAVPTTPERKSTRKEDVPVNTKEMLVERLSQKEATIGIVGLGYVGLPLVLRYTDVGYRGLGIDVDCEKVEKLNRGESYIEHTSLSSEGSK